MMNRSLVVVVALAVALATVGPGAVGAVTSGPTAERPAAPPDNGTENASMGASISGFMQASAADAEGEVDNEVFRARMDDASNESQRALVAERTETLQAQLERLREQRRAILTQEGNLTVADRAKAARLTAEINSLRRGINTTDQAASAAGINEPSLDQLRRNASDLNGSEVSDIAGDIADPPRRGERGPENRTEGGDAPGEGTNESRSDERARTDNATDAPDEGNGSNPDGEGPPGDKGRSDDTGAATPTPTATETEE
ncbi:hypothetical protein BRD04_03725 [Halobacteriales archaeon QS_9_67_17]|nr:MAG: hypothetical protein BRD04_03725 [Halobacteriales archaeon QS_9_67_17]